MEKSEQLSERSILNIVDAYVHLPRFFPMDLLEDIKDMIFLTLQQNPINLKSFFLLEFLEKILLMKRRRLPEDKQAQVLDEIAKRIQSEEFMNRPRSYERAAEIAH